MDKTTIQRLQKHLSYRKSQAIRLEQENRLLHAKHSILQAYCQALSWMHEQIGLEWLNDVTPPQQQGLQAVAPDTDGYSTEELLLLHHDELVQQLDGKAPSILLDQQANLRQQQVTHLENGSSSDDWLQELKPPRVAAAATAAAAGVRAPDSRLGNSSYDGALRTNSLQCMGIEPVSADAVAAAEGHVMGKEPTIAPDSDLMYIFRRSFAMPPFPGAADMSMRDVSTVYNEVIQELSLNLALHEAATQDAAEVGDAAAPYSGPHSQLQLQGIQAAFDRLWNLRVTLSRLQRNGIIMAIVLVNHADMSELPRAESDLSDHIRCMRAVGLSRSQQQQIADGFAIFGKLLEPVLQGMRQLQLQQPAEDRSNATPGSSSAAGVSSARNNSSSNAGLASDGGSKQQEQQAAAAAAAVSAGASDLLTAEGYKTHREVLHQTEQRALQMKQLLQKDVLVKAAFTAYMFGHFTYTQLAKLYVTMYPRQPAIATVGKAVVALLIEAQQ